MLVERRTDASGLTIVPSGEIDIANVSTLVRALSVAVADGATRICVDLDGLAFMDAAVLNALVAARWRCRRAGARLTVSCTDPRRIRLFQVTGLEDLLLLHALHASQFDQAAPSTDQAQVHGQRTR